MSSRFDKALYRDIRANSHKLIVPIQIRAEEILRDGIVKLRTLETESIHRIVEELSLGVIKRLELQEPGPFRVGQS